MIEFLSLINLLFLFLVIFPASFAVPTGSLFFIVSLSALSESTMEILIIILIIIFATILGDITTYLIAKKYNKKIYDLIYKSKFLKRQEKKTNKLFKKHVMTSLFISRFFLQGIGPFLNYYAGMKKLKIKKFILPIILGEIVYSVIYVSIGVLFRDTWKDFLNFLSDFSILIVLILLVAIVIEKLRK